MSRRRWIADEFDERRAALVGEHAAHLTRVLRARVGQEFDVAAGGRVCRARVVSVTDARVEFELGEEIPSAGRAGATVLLSIFKFDRFEWAVEKLTELGVGRIVPVVAARTDAHLAAAAEKRSERWRRIAQQAAEQSRRAQPPEIAPPMKLKPALELEGDVRLVLAEPATAAPSAHTTLTLRAALEQHPAAHSFVLAIGPEGGWTDAELHQFAESGWQAVSLGTTVLRAETAAIAAVAALAAMRSE